MSKGFSTIEDCTRAWLSHGSEVLSYTASLAMGKPSQSKLLSTPWELVHTQCLPFTSNLLMGAKARNILSVSFSPRLE
jgi:hypothetical protein